MRHLYLLWISGIAIAAAALCALADASPLALLGPFGLVLAGIYCWLRDAVSPC